MLVIRDAQMRAFEETAIQRYVVELAAHCREFSPRLCNTLSAEELHTAVEQGILRAEAHGFTQRGPVRYYIDMQILFGSGFDSDPQYPWAEEILAKDDHQMDRAESLHVRTQEYLSRVDGPHNLHTLKALAELAALHRQGIALPPESFEQESLRLMSEIHPRKVEQTGTVALQRLIAAGTAKGRDVYGFRAVRSLGLMGVLMFAFGHQFDVDPLLPWIERTLSRMDRADPDRTADKLERRALVWLDAVLRNAEGEQ